MFGKALIEEVIRVASLNENRRLTLNVNRNNKAVEFYKSLGSSSQHKKI